MLLVPALTVLILLYALTWIDGSACYRRELQAQCNAEYTAAIASKTKLLAAEPETPMAFLFSVRPGGPLVAVHWSVPILPGVLMVNSEYSLGPMMAEGGPKLIWYNGARTGFICWAWRYWVT
jgi:hypothetical protein